MSRTWEEVFSGWAQAPGKTEETRIENAIGAIKNAIAKSTKLQKRRTKVYVQGSYRNRVNVRQDSDVDIGVLCDDVFLATYPDGKGHADFGNSSASYTYAEFKNEVEEALVDYFGREAVRRGKKAINVGENSYHIDADVSAFFEYRQYWDSGSFRAGVAMNTDLGRRIENYPERLLESWPHTPQHYENGVAKNTTTGRSFKGVARIVKKLRNTMDEAAIAEAAPIPGFLIESMIWNASDWCFEPTTWDGRVQRVFAVLWDGTDSDAKCDQWCEVNGIKYLFRPSQKWTRIEAHAFIDRAWSYIGHRTA